MKIMEIREKRENMEYDGKHMKLMNDYDETMESQENYKGPPRKVE